MPIELSAAFFFLFFLIEEEEYRSTIYHPVILEWTVLL